MKTNNLKKIYILVAIVFVLIIIYLTFFNKTKIKVLQGIFNEYKDGEISECLTDGKIYFSAGYNAYDGGSEVFNLQGLPVGSTQGFTGKYSGPKLDNCTRIYAVPKNIWGIPAINTYNLK